MNERFLSWSDDLPYGITDLEEDAALKFRAGSQNGFVSNEQIRCCVRSCPNSLSRRRRGQTSREAIYCPEHGVSVSTSPTYIFEDYHRNFIIGRNLLESVKKVERWRLGNENSEDALTWNVLLGFLSLGGLRSLFEELTDLRPLGEPELYLWGNRIGNGEIRFWKDLEEVRDALEARAGLPTEPDAVLRVPGQAVVLVEAKFGSPNGTFAGKEERFGGIEEYLGRYHAREKALDPLKREWIEQQKPEDILEQLCRNAVFAHWLARDGEKPFVVNLVRRSAEKDVESRFGNHINKDVIGFRRVAWEQLYELPEVKGADGAPLRLYMQNKSLKLAKAFEL